MPRNRRITVFLNDHEYQLIQSVQPPDISLGATLRRLACDRAQWLNGKGYKSRAGKPQHKGTQPDENDQHNPSDGPAFIPDPQ